MADFPKLPRVKQDDENMEKLHTAARRGQADLVRRLVSTGVDPGIQNKFGCTGFHLAAKFGQVRSVKELASSTDPSGMWHGQRPLHLAVQSGNLEVVQAVVEAAKNHHKDPAAFVNELDEYELFEVAGRAKHVQGQTALHWAVTARNMAMIKALLALGANPTAKDKGGETPLMRCIEFGLTDEFNVLMHVPNIRLEISDRGGRTHLHWALLHNHQDMAKAIVAAGHDLTMEDQDKNAPWMLAALAGMPQLLDQMLQSLDAFAVQQASFHNGVQVLPDRLHWLPFTTEDSVRNDVVKVLQRKLDTMAKSAAVNQRDGKKQGPMTVAPSAPVKKAA